MLKTARPAWGCGRVVPEGAMCSWGARAIDHGGRSLDIVWDRQGFADIEYDAASLAPGPRVAELMSRLNNGGLEVCDQKMQGLAAIRRWPLDGPTVLVERDGLVIMGDTQRSHGYVYLAAWLTHHIATEAKEAESA